ncbi:MAG: hypothetical protein ACLQFW_15830 [Xanthobacteraceae bacterium]
MALRDNMAFRYKKEKGAKRGPDPGLKVIKWVRAPVGDDENTGVSLSANACGHAACGGQETIILLMRPDAPTIGIRISKSVETVTQADVAEALQPMLAPAQVSRVR